MIGTGPGILVTESGSSDKQMSQWYQLLIISCTVLLPSITNTLTPSDDFHKKDALDDGLYHCGDDSHPRRPNLEVES